MKLPGWLNNLLHNRSEAESIALRPDRVILTGTLLPAFTGFRRTLWIGCQAYTPPYYATLESGGGECWTLDLNPESAAWGREGRHVIGDLTQADTLFAPAFFDAVICNGIFGWGVNSLEERSKALAAMATILKPDGVLLMGWNNHKTDDPVPLASALFARTVLQDVPSHITVGQSTHRYDLLRKV